MNWIFQNSGLSARRRSIKRNFQNIFSLNGLTKRAIFLALLVGASAALSSCDKKVNDDNLAQVSEQPSVGKDTLDKPKVNIKVNKHYDGKGNLIGFDSTYSSFYSNVTGDTVKMDSLMENFDRYFDRDHSSFFDRRFNTLFFNDSARYPDFFHKDFFMKRYELNDQYLKDMMNEMDSIKNRFFKEQSRNEKESRDL